VEYALQLWPPAFPGQGLDHPLRDQSLARMGASGGESDAGVGANREFAGRTPMPIPQNPGRIAVRAEDVIKPRYAPAPLSVPT
jgi:hypothetical protein